MKVWGLSSAEIQNVVRHISEKEYDGNVQIKDGIKEDGRAHRFTLRVANSRGAGAKMSASGRRSVAANWYVHRDVMLEMFSYNPDARILTAMADYRGVDDFFAKFEDTRYTNVGSIMNPVAYGSL